eukprot:EG_transcript_14578
MHQKQRYRELLFVSDTCEAATLHAHFYSPNLLAIGSAKLGQSSYSLLPDTEVGVPIIDRFTYYLLGFMEGVNQTSSATLQALFQSFDPIKLASDPEHRADLYKRPLHKVRVTEFFSEQIQLYPTPLTPPAEQLLGNIRDSDPIPSLDLHATEEAGAPELPSSPPGPTTLTLACPLSFWVGLLSLALTFLAGARM